VFYLNDVPTAPSIIDKTQVIPETIREAKDDVLVHGVTLGLKVVY
jgi:hypothetical protein